MNLNPTDYYFVNNSQVWSLIKADVLKYLCQVFFFFFLPTVTWIAEQNVKIDICA